MDSYTKRPAIRNVVPCHDIIMHSWNKFLVLLLYSAIFLPEKTVYVQGSIRYNLHTGGLYKQLHMTLLAIFHYVSALTGILLLNKATYQDDVIKWKHFPRNWPFERGIHRSPVNSPHKGQWRRTLMFSLIRAWIKVWVYNREANDLRRHRAHYDVTVMWRNSTHVALLPRARMFRSTIVVVSVAHRSPIAWALFQTWLKNVSGYKRKRQDYVCAKWQYWSNM